MRAPVLLATILPAAASAFALIYGGAVAGDALAEIVDPLAQSSLVNFARYAYVLTHLVVSIGLLAGGAVGLRGLRKGSSTTLLAGQLVAVAAFCSMLAMQMLALWELAPGA